MVNGGRSMTLPNHGVNIPTMDPMEIPPKVPPRKESINHTAKPELLPIHLISATNQSHTPAVHQRIPTKLAAPSKGKEKSKTKKTHQRTNSAGNDNSPLTSSPSVK